MGKTDLWSTTSPEGAARNFAHLLLRSYPVPLETLTAAFDDLEAVLVHLVRLHRCGASQQLGRIFGRWEAAAIVYWPTAASFAEQLQGLRRQLDEDYRG